MRYLIFLSSSKNDIIFSIKSSTDAVVYIKNESSVGISIMTGICFL